MAFQLNSFANKQCEVSPQTSSTPMPSPIEVTRAEFLEDLTAVHKNFKEEILVVSFVYQTDDFLTVDYDGKNDKQIDKALVRAKAGDKIIIESKKKSAAPTTKYVLK